MMDLQTKLTQPFPLGSHKWRVLNVSKKKDKATWYVYIDARDVASRLDETGLDWSDGYEVIAMNDNLCVVQCKLTIGNSTRTDVGSDSKQSNDSEGNYIKGAYSDAFKRAAVKFGIGRYLYGLTSVYVDIDEFKRFTLQSEQRIKAHLVKELKALGADGDPSHLRGENDNEESEPISTAVHRKPANGNGHNGDGNLASQLVDVLAKREKDSTAKASEAMYRFAVGVVDGLTQADGHKPMFAHICQREVSSADPCGNGVAKYIIDYAREQATKKEKEEGHSVNPTYNAKVAESFRQLWRQLQEDAGQSDLWDDAGPHDTEPEAEPA